MDSSNCDCTTLDGVSCEVENCKHNNGCGCCTAHDITVSNRMALLGEQTRCNTFEEME